MTSLFPISQTALSGVAKPLARIEKPSAGSGLHDGATTREERKQASSQGALRRGLSRSETEDAPRWYGPRLTAPFVAQILGQVLPQSGPDAQSANAAYRSGPALFPAGVCFDSEA
ncbi:MAG TPA: hypothetical protein VMD53_03865 [Rhizomicrobium sp.]|nr:hypothetical protein [Rhizomicrobium sp.]